MDICTINHSVPARKRARRIGRGAGSGSGKTAGRGQKGLGSRTGGNFLRGYVGGQTQLKNRFPKRGFNNAEFALTFVPVNLGLLAERFDDGETVNPDTLNQKGVTVRRGDHVKVLGTGECAKKLTVQAHAFSGSAKEKLEKAGGKAEVLSCPCCGEKRAKKLARMKANLEATAAKKAETEKKIAEGKAKRAAEKAAKAAQGAKAAPKAPKADKADKKDAKKAAKK